MDADETTGQVHRKALIGQRTSTESARVWIQPASNRRGPESSRIFVGRRVRRLPETRAHLQMKITPPSSSSPLEDTRMSSPDAPLSSSSRISVADLYPAIFTPGNTLNRRPGGFRSLMPYNKRAPFSALPNTRAGAIDDETANPDSKESSQRLDPQKVAACLLRRSQWRVSGPGHSSLLEEIFWLRHRSRENIWPMAGL